MVLLLRLLQRLSMKRSRLSVTSISLQNISWPCTLLYIHSIVQQKIGSDLADTVISKVVPSLQNSSILITDQRQAVHQNLARAVYRNKMLTVEHSTILNLFECVPTMRKRAMIDPESVGSYGVPQAIVRCSDETGDSQQLVIHSTTLTSYSLIGQRNFRSGWR